MRLSLGLVVVLAACNPVVAHTPDATTIDASPDAPTHGTVTVKVFDPSSSGAVVVGIPVVFIEADGSLVGHPVTAADGTASADVHTGASATAVIAQANSTQIETVVGLVPGDHVNIGPSGAPATAVGSFSVSFPAYSGATSYNVYGPCGSTSGTASPVVLQMQSDCKLDTMDLTVVPMDSGGNGLAYLTKTGVAFVANGTTTMTGAYTGMSAFTATVTNIGSTVTQVGVGRFVPDTNGFSNQTSGAPTNGMITLMAPGPSGTKALVSSQFSTANSQQAVLQSIAGNVQTYGLDAGMTLLPWVGPMVFDLANHKIMVPTSTAGTTSDAPDVFFVQAGYSRTVGMTTSNFMWVVIGPTATDVTLPVLPVDVGDVMPKATDTSQGLFGVMLEADTYNGYNDVRQDLYGTLGVITGPHTTAMRIRESVGSSP